MMQRSFSNRDDLISYLRAQFPEVASRSPEVSATIGGRQAAEARLREIDPRRYASSRNRLGGAVTRLSPYLRHGVLSLAEVRDAALDAVRRPEEAAKFINELGWRDYWQRVYASIGDGIWQDREAYKTGWPASGYAAELPADIAAGQTGRVCIDAFSHELRTTGYLHNHARMWLAAYLVHWRRVRWQTGAAWFLEHLLDGDPASNNLSWQWVASTFSHKPYIFNRENLERNTDGALCQTCPLYGHCDFEGSYEELETRLFADEATRAAVAQQGGALISTAASRAAPAPPLVAVPPGTPAVVWLHGDDLSPYSPALNAHPGAAALFVFDDELLANWRISMKRLVFLYECLLELPVAIRRGQVAAEVLAFAAEHGAGQVATSPSPSPRFSELRQQIAARLPVQLHAGEPFVKLDRPPNLGRFSRYWRTAEPRAFIHSRRQQQQLF